MVLYFKDSTKVFSLADDEVGDLEWPKGIWGLMDDDENGTARVGFCLGFGFRVSQGYHSGIKSLSAHRCFVTTAQSLKRAHHRPLGRVAKRKSVGGGETLSRRLTRRVRTMSRRAWWISPHRPLIGYGSASKTRTSSVSSNIFRRFPDAFAPGVSPSKLFPTPPPPPRGNAVSSSSGSRFPIFLTRRAINATSQGRTGCDTRGPKGAPRALTRMGAARS